MSSSSSIDPTNQQQQQQQACPVDHKSREAWLERAREASSVGSSPGGSLPPSHPPIQDGTKAESCPVDHGAREVWMQQARAASQGNNAPSPIPQQPRTQSSTTTTSSWSSYLPRIPYFSSSSSSSASTSSTSKQPATSSPASQGPSLGIDREVSTIPRTTTPDPSMPTPAAATHSTPIPTTTRAPTTQTRVSPANNEQETGADGATGNWVYPSERMFFEAMKRKGHDPRAADMRTVVPIHNAVNERAWAEIKEWEGPWVQGTSCQGPRLHSFSGLSTQLSPRARLNTFLGYQAPFDRHDWVVDRCGKEIEYVIDFYAGRSGTPNGGLSPEGKLSFYLDVRPKLNSWEGVKMRVCRTLGIS